MSRYEYSFWQWTFSGLRRSWTQPYCDVGPADRILDSTPVSRTEPIDWAGNKYEYEKIQPPHAFRPGQRAGGRSMQMAHPTRTVPITVNNTYQGRTYTAQIPLPADGSDYWVSHNPTPQFAMRSDAVYDKNIVLIHGDGSSTEIIGYTPWFGRRCLGLARWDAKGFLHPDDTPVSWGGAAVAPRMLNRDDPPHRISLILRGRDHDPESFPWRGEWLALDPAAVPPNLTGDAKWYADILVNYGAIVDDHGGRTGISWSDGRQWDGMASLSGLGFRLGQMRRVIS